MLTKNFNLVFTPGTPEQQEVAGGVFCYAQPESGYWATQCSQIELPLNTGVFVPAGATPVFVYDAAGNLIRVYCIVCVSTWVSTGPSGPPTCVTIEPQPYRPAVRSRVEWVPTAGWDAGANSVQARDGDCEVRLTMGLVTGVYVGLTDDLAEVEDLDRYAHAFYFHQHSSVPLFRVIDRTSSRSHDIEYTAGDEFRIRRMGALVTYWHNDTLLYTSDDPIEGSIRVGSTLYLSGDMIP